MALDFYKGNTATTVVVTASALLASLSCPKEKPFPYDTDAIVNMINTADTDPDIKVKLPAGQRIARVRLEIADVGLCEEKDGSNAVVVYLDNNHSLTRVESGRSCPDEKSARFRRKRSKTFEGLDAVRIEAAADKYKRDYDVQRLAPLERSTP